MSILVLTSDTLIGTPATGNLEYNGQFYGTDSNASRAQLQRLVLETAKASTSGTTVDFTGIPAWVKRLTVMLSGVSTNGTSNLLIQLGYQSPVTSTGYVSRATSVSAAVSSTAGFIITQALSANTDTITGNIIITTLGNNVWVSGGNINDVGQNTIIMSAGNVTLGGTLDRVTVTSVTPNTFDAGSINILYEG